MPLFSFPLCSGPLRRLRRHLPRTRGRLPSQALRASSPGGRAKFTPVGRGKLCGKTKFLPLFLTTNFAKIDAGTLASPRGGGGTALCAVTERGGSHACGGTNSDRVQRTKQGAVSGAALHFSQGHSCPRGKVAKRKRGWRAAHKGGETERATKKRPFPGALAFV